MVRVNRDVQGQGLRALEVAKAALQMLCKFVTYVLSLPSRGIILQVNRHHVTPFSSAQEGAFRVIFIDIVHANNCR